jgi:ankyrin repeat protein
MKRNDETWKCLSDANVSRITELVRAGVNVNKRNERGETPLIAAFHGLSVDRFDLVKVLLNAGVKVNSQSNNGTTALMNAVLYGQLDAVCLLLERGANVILRDSKQRTAYDIAKTLAEHSVPFPRSKSILQVVEAAYIQSGQLQSEPHKISRQTQHR